MVRAKNVLSVMMQCFAITALVTVLWTIYGYSLAFDTTGMTQEGINLYTFIGGLGKAFLSGVTRDSLTLTIPETVFMTYQMTFAIITPALIVGAFAERMKFSALLLLHGALVHFRLRPHRPHGLERQRRVDVGLGRPGLRRRHGGAYQRGHRRSGGVPGAGQAQGLSDDTPCRRTT